MYLPRSSKWSMTRRRRRPNYFGWAVLALVLLLGYYFNQVYLPSQPNPFEPTPTATRSPESFVTEAETLFKQGKLTQSIEAYKQAIRSSPEDASLYIAVARVQVWAGQYAEAQANAENALLLNPNNSMAHAVRAWALDFQEGRNSDALEEIDKALELDPNNAIAHAYRVEILIDSGSFDNIAKAIEASRAAIALDPNALETRRARGYIFEATSDYENAIQFYKSAIEINPYIPILHIELGRNLRFAGLYDDAIREYTLANTLNPSDPDPELFISRTYATVGDYAKAVQYAEQAVKDNPTDPALHGNYGVMLYRNLSWPEAVDQFRLALKGGVTPENQTVQGLPLTPNDVRVAEYYYTYALALARTNQCGEALQLTQTLRSRIPSNEDAMAAADKAEQICQENLNNPPASTSTPASTPSTPEAGATAQATVTPTPTQ